MRQDSPACNPRGTLGSLTPEDERFVSKRPVILALLRAWCLTAPLSPYIGRIERLLDELEKES